MREFDDPKYKEWRLAVKRRDRFRCRMPGCKSRKRLHAHHIKRWADFPTLRYVVSNGITLCDVCHKKVFGNEQVYESVFATIVNAAGSVAVLAKLYASNQQNEQRPG